MKKELEEKLFNRFNFFKPGKSPKETLMCFGFECDDGWFDLIWKLCENIEKELKYLYILYDEEPFKVVQVKEKFGGLRFYTNWETEEISNLIETAEEKSYTICEICGGEGSLRRGGWLKTLCDKHAKNSNFEEEKNYMKLAEVLMLRSDLTKKLKKLEEEIESSLFTFDKEEVSIQNTYIEDKIDEFNQVSQSLMKVNIEIDKANTGIRDKIKQIQKLDRLIGFYNNLRKEILGKNNVYMYKEIQKYPCIEIYYLNDLLESCEKSRRDLDKEIQKYNWETKLDIDI